MALPPRTPRDPLHEPLREVRRGLLRLHKALIDAEREAFQAGHGGLSNTQFLQALVDDPFFQWLRPFSGLIVEIDGALASRDAAVTPPQARYFVDRVAGLVNPAPVGMIATARLQQLRRQDAGVGFAHGELMRALAVAMNAYPAA